MKNDNREKGERVLAAVGITASAITAASSPLGLLALVPESVRLLKGVWDSVNVERADRLLHEIFGSDLTDLERTAALDEALRNRHVEQVIVQALRSALDAVGDHVLRALGNLVGQYKASGSESDSYFRACCRLLQEVSPEEYRSLGALVHRLAESHFPDEVSARVSVEDGTGEDLRRVDGAPPTGPFVIVTANGFIVRPSDTLAVVGCDPAHVSRLTHLLDRQLLGRRHVSGRSDEHEHLTIQVGLARRLARIL